MLIVHVDILTKPECAEAFKNASIENARNSALEPGIARFDVCQDTAEPAHFVLIEIYRDANAPAAHKETAHYQTWRDTVAEMMARPRQSTKYENCFPADSEF